MNSSGNNSSSVNKDVANMFADLPQPLNCSLASYVWIGRDCKHCRYKTRTLEFVPQNLSDCPWWDMCDEVDTFLEPVSLFSDPFYPNGSNKLILCENYSSMDKSILAENNRHNCKLSLEKAAAKAKASPLLYITQNYTLLDRDGLYPIGQTVINQNHAQVHLDNVLTNHNTVQKYFLNNEIKATDFMASITNGNQQQSHGVVESNDKNNNYCSIGSNKSCGRNIAESHYKACIYAGVRIASANIENLFQWQFQIGPCEGVEAADHLWMARFILQRVAEDYGVVASFDPNLLPRNVAFDSGCFKSKYYFSTSEMRLQPSSVGLANMKRSIRKLKKQFSLDNSKNKCENLLLLNSQQEIKFNKNIFFIKNELDNAACCKSEKLFRICMEETKLTGSDGKDDERKTKKKKNNGYHHLGHHQNIKHLKTNNCDDTSTSKRMVIINGGDEEEETDDGNDNDDDGDDNDHDDDDDNDGHDVCVSLNKNGYIEINSILSNCDPYLIINMLTNAIVLDEYF